MKRSNEPFLWSLFSSGGMLAALTLPATVLVLWIAAPLGWVDLSQTNLRGVLAPPIVRLGLFVVVTLSLFHWGHRFRFTLYDGLQLSHLWGMIAAICYGGASAATLLAAYVLWTY